MLWEVVYEQAIREDGTLFFSEKLTKEFLLNVRKTMGSYIYANQYLNQIVPDDEKKFRKEWLRYFKELPERVHNFGFIDPAISRRDGSDYTALVIVSVDVEGHWYVRYAARDKLTPTEIVTISFNAVKQWNLQILGIEDIAYQRALLYMIEDEGKKRGQVLPVKGIGLGDSRHKDTRILGLVPRFEWNRISLSEGLYDLENELNFFPRGSKDIVDALARIEQIAYAPEREKKTHEEPPTNSPEYESWLIRKLHREASRRYGTSED